MLTTPNASATAVVVVAVAAAAAATAAAADAAAPDAPACAIFVCSSGRTKLCNAPLPRSTPAMPEEKDCDTGGSLTSAHLCLPFLRWCHHLCNLLLCARPLSWLGAGLWVWELQSAQVHAATGDENRKKKKKKVPPISQCGGYV